MKCVKTYLEIENYKKLEQFAKGAQLTKSALIRIVILQFLNKGYEEALNLFDSINI